MPTDSPRKATVVAAGWRRMPAWGWLLLLVCAAVGGGVALGRRSSTSALVQFVSSAHALVATSADARRDESYWQWSNTFGRELRWGAGDGCDASTHLARTSSHALINVESRTQFGALMDSLGATGLGVELGVQRAEFSYEMLTGWTNVSRYFLVDPWAHQSDYVDAANVEQSSQEQILAEARANLDKPEWRDKVEWVRKMSYEAAKDFPDCHFDFIYVDAVHDYDGALVDMLDWWPKLKPGGVMAGHDYLTVIIPGDTIFGVKAAADRFAVAVNRPLYVTLGDGDYASFYMIK